MASEQPHIPTRQARQCVRDASPGPGVKRTKKFSLKWSWVRWRFRRNARRALILLARLDLFMKVRGWPEWQRKQFWHDFITSPRARAGQIALIAALIGTIPKPKSKPAEVKK